MKYPFCKICNASIAEESEKFELVKCSNCEIVFYKDNLDNINLEEYYNGIYKSDYQNYQSQSSLLWNGKDVSVGYDKGKVLKHIIETKPKKVAEIGAGVGLVAKFFSIKEIEYIGFEPATVIAESAKSVGFNIYPKDFNALHDYPATFDSIVAFEVIEHIDKLDACFKAIDLSLKPKGLFGFTVPNYEKRLNYENPGESLHQPGPPLHVNFFTEQSIRKIAAHYKLKVIYLEVRKFPSVQLKVKTTLRLFTKMLTGSFYGSNIFCVLQKPE